MSVSIKGSVWVYEIFKLICDRKIVDDLTLNKCILLSSKTIKKHLFFF